MPVVFGRASALFRNITFVQGLMIDGFRIWHKKILSSSTIIRCGHLGTNRCSLSLFLLGNLQLARLDFDKLDFVKACQFAGNHRNKATKRHAHGSWHPIRMARSFQEAGKRRTPSTTEMLETSSISSLGSQS